MQVTREAEPNTIRRVGVKEELINFRSSPNLKNMKKFLRSRSDYTETTAATHYEPQLDSPKFAQNMPQTETKPVFQPPLPTYPPPPDSPPSLNVTIKKEKEDPDIETGQNNETINQEQIIPPGKVENDGPKRAMCKEWARGDCKRSVCRYSHELDVTQLRGVYTFCWNYQNDRCSYPYCKFVHASIFEEAEFLRTGVLPPHAKSHLKKPLPPPPPPEDGPNGLHSNFNNPPPVQIQVLDKQHPIISCVQASSLEERQEDFVGQLTCELSPLKRKWSDIDFDFSSSPRDIQPNDHLAKKCKTCGITEFRLEFHKEIFENLIQRTGEVTKNVNNLEKKRNKLTLVSRILKSASNTMNIGSGDVDKDKIIMEQLSNFTKLSSSSLMM